ncbi:hypothetical protein CLU79DRAFT_711053, partial [Phycomyces nitens]
FRSTPLPHDARNIWFRALHRKISCRARLNSMIPSPFPHSSCAICLTDSDNQEHFLFSCPSKLSVRSSLWMTYFGTVITADEL